MVKESWLFRCVGSESGHRSPLVIRLTAASDLSRDYYLLYDHAVDETHGLSAVSVASVPGRWVCTVEPFRKEFQISRCLGLSSQSLRPSVAHKVHESAPCRGFPRRNRRVVFNGDFLFTTRHSDWSTNPAHA